MAVSGRVDDSVCPDGDCLLSSGPGIAQPDGFNRLQRPAPFRFYVATPLFQHGTIPVCLYLARDFVAAHLNYTHPVLSDIQAGGASHAAISRMRDLCGLSEFCHLSVKSTVGSLRE